MEGETQELEHEHRWGTFPELTQPVCLDCGEYAPYDLARFETWRTPLA